MADTKVEAVVSFIRNNRTFEVVSGYDALYNHMGATITDAVLQAGITYENVVKPRVEEVLRKYPDARTTSGFLRVLRQIGPEEVLRWHGPDKTDRIVALTELLDSEGVQTETEFTRWLDLPGSRERLLRLRGIGNKTVDYMGILVGKQAIAVDTHLFSFLDRAGARCKGYEEAKELLTQVADELGIPCLTLDHSIWAFTAKQRTGRKP